MFDMGFTEMMLIGIVALVVIGPERLPGVARTTGKYVGRLKRFMTSVKADVEQELRADELREILSQQQEELNSLKDTISEAGKDIEKQANVIDAVSETLAQDADDSPPPANASELDDVPPEPGSTGAASSTKPAPRKKSASTKSASTKSASAKSASAKSASAKSASAKSPGKKSVSTEPTSKKSARKSKS